MLGEVSEGVRVLLGRKDVRVESDSLSGRRRVSLTPDPAKEQRGVGEAPPLPPQTRLQKPGAGRCLESQAAPAELRPCWAERFLPDPSSAWRDRTGDPATPTSRVHSQTRQRGQRAGGPHTLQA